MKKDEKERSRAAGGEAEGDHGFNADDPPDMEVALRCITLLEDLGSGEMLEGILETIRSIRDKMTDPCARKLIEERLRELTGKQGKNHARLFRTIGQPILIQPSAPSRNLEMGKAPEPDHDGLINGLECILLVEDDQTVRDVAEYVLKRCGYTVLLAEDGERALEIYRERRCEISLVVLDLVMPGMGGRRCFEELLMLDPGMKIVIVSGYSVDGPPKSFLDAGAKEFVKKPYDVKNLTRIIRKVLDTD
jgi:CheY-like chemotaxis protein